MSPAVAGPRLGYARTRATMVEATLNCPNCGNPTRAGAKFCRVCGQQLERTCPNGHAVAADARFCEECGAAVAGPEGITSATAEPSLATLEGGEALGRAERRLVSVLFADLVGFTSLSEHRDPEEVREILSRYFDRMREIVVRHGGVVEKFIGDAVMAVWGTPTAHEDDAERAARAALSMIDGVAAMNHGLELPPGTLALRVGVTTGEAAITVGASGQGMVAGDLVNTASRVQAAAASGSALVDEATRRAAEASIAFEEAGEHQLKGKATPIRVWRALRVLSGRRGSGKSTGLEAPFVGRDEELRLIIELFHATARERKARLVSVMGIAGIGKTRLSWEFEKYLDGVADTVLWHRGRCLAYGEGVTYWALAEMVRMRARMVEDEDAATALPKLREVVEQYVSDPSEQRWIEPKLAHLLGLASAGEAPSDQNEVFSAWRLFFERLAERNPVVMVFEDLQWADSSLLDFIGHMLDWSRNVPLLILTLARPELTERRPTWGTATKSFTSIYLEPLSTDAMDQLLSGLAPGLSEELRVKIAERAEGVPLYAVETVRMLLDQGALAREGDRYVLQRPVDILDVPETLHSLMAARLDALPEEERAALRTASVLGKTFTPASLAAVAGTPEVDVRPTLDSLVRKEMLTVENDPRSPERGQYGFLQVLVKDVAYQTLGRRERRALHLAAARHLESIWSEEDEIIQIVAAHYLEAYRSLPDADDAVEIKSRAARALARAGDRAASLAANEEAERYFERATELTEDAEEQAGLLDRAGRMAQAGGRLDQAIKHLEQAAELFEREGNQRSAAGVSAELAEVLWNQGHIEQGIERMEQAFEVLSREEPDEKLATVAGLLGRLRYFHGDLELARERIEVALAIAERKGIPDVIAHGLNTKYLILKASDRPEEAAALLLHSLRVAVENDLPLVAIRAYNNLVVEFSEREQDETALEYAADGLALARKLGNRWWEWAFLNLRSAVAMWRGEWDESLALVNSIPHPDDVPGSTWAFTFASAWAVYTHVHRGELADAERRVQDMERLVGASQDLQARNSYLIARIWLREAQHEYDDALTAGDEAAKGLGRLGFYAVGDELVAATEAALAAGQIDKARGFLRSIEENAPIGSRFYRAQALRLRARERWETGRENPEPEFKGAIATLEEVNRPFELGIARLEYAEWLTAAERSEEAHDLAGQARTVFEGLRAVPWIERVDGLQTRMAAGAPVSPVS